MGEANIRNLMTPQENQGFRCERTSDWGPASSATQSVSDRTPSNSHYRFPHFRAICDCVRYRENSQLPYMSEILAAFLRGRRRQYHSTIWPFSTRRLIGAKECLQAAKSKQAANLPVIFLATGILLCPGALSIGGLSPFSEANSEYKITREPPVFCASGLLVQNFSVFPFLAFADAPSDRACGLS